MTRREPEAVEVRCANRDHGVIHLGYREDVGVAVAVHFDRYHNGQSVVVDGEDFILGPAPERCDFCGSLVEHPVWFHRTDKPLIEIGDLDGEWNSCGVCHDAIQRNDLAALIERSVQIHAEMSPNIPSSAVRNVSRKQFAYVLPRLDPVGELDPA